jgi:hypothetical protein
MPQLYGQSLSRREFEQRVGHTRQVFGVRLVELADGVERGVRTLEFQTGSGLMFSVLVDRSMDIGHFDYRGVPFAWQSATGFRQPPLISPMDEGGTGFMRGFSGLWCTCGLDHIRQPDAGPADHFDLPLRSEIRYPMHGRGAFQPCVLNGYGERWEGDECWLWAEGTLTQAQVLGEHLRLVRRIEVQAGGSEIHVTDTVSNEGFNATPHMLLYHINLGWPLLDEGSRFVAPVTGILAANMSPQTQQTGYRLQSGPRSRFVQQVFDLAYQTDAQGQVPVALVNDRLGLGFAYTFDSQAFPCLQQWQGFGEGVYGFGIEPATSHWGSRADADRKSEIVWLEHGDSRIYRSRIAVLGDATAIAEHEARVRQITPQLLDEFAPRLAQPPEGPFVTQIPNRQR